MTQRTKEPRLTTDELEGLIQDSEVGGEPWHPYQERLIHLALLELHWFRFKCNCGAQKYE